MDQDLLVRLQLVEFVSKSLDPDKDSLIKRLIDLNFWDFRIKCRIEAAEWRLPLDIETEFMEVFVLPLPSDNKKLFSKLLSNRTGLLLKTLGFEGCESTGWNDPETCTGKLRHLKLVRRNGPKLKELKIAFDPRAQFLIGTREVPYA